MCQRGRSLRDDAGRLLRGVGGLRADWPGLVGVAGEEDEAAAGGEPRSVEVPAQPRVTVADAQHGTGRLEQQQQLLFTSQRHGAFSSEDSDAAAAAAAAAEMIKPKPEVRGGGKAAWRSGGATVWSPAGLSLGLCFPIPSHILLLSPCLDTAAAAVTP